MGHDQAPANSSRAHMPTQKTPGRVDITPGAIDPAETGMDTVRNRLWDRFELSRARTEDAGYEFLPRRALTAVLTDETIQSLLRQRPETEGVSLHDITGDKARIKIFAILLLMDQTQHIGHIIQQGVSDQDLPLGRDRLRTCLRKEATLVRAFLSSQYEVDVPVWDFSAHEIQEDQYEWDQKLPFLTKCPLSSGGQGEVWTVEIHRDHYDTRTQSDRWERLHRGPEFALKEFGNKSDFTSELDALKLFSQHDTKHQHLIRALAAYSQCGKHFLIFPLAQGNLDTAWQDACPALQDPLWLLVQFHGLTQGLHRIHQYTSPRSSPKEERLLGRHGDIKPQNILWFRDPSSPGGRLVLSDFTLMRFHAEGSNKETTMARIGGTRTYHAPEVAVMSSRHVTQRYDVWSLGCVFLESISCYLVGYNATRGKYFQGDDGRHYQSFGVARLMEDSIEWGYPEDKYFLCKPGLQEAEVKKSVRKWFRYLHGQRNCSDALHDFLDVIQEHMLVHKPGTRWPVQKVLEKLATILARSRHQDNATGYCSVGNPWETRTSEQFPPLWDEDEYCQRRRPHFDSQSSTQSDLASSAFPSGSARPEDRKGLADDFGSKHDFGQIENIFADEIMPSRPSVPTRVESHSAAAATGSMPPTWGDIPQDGPSSQDNNPEGWSSSEATTGASGQKLCLPVLPRGSAPVPDRPPDLPADTAEAPYTALLRVNGNIVVPQRPPDVDFLTTPATSYCPVSSEARSTYTEDPRPSTWSRTEESMSEMEGRSERSRLSGDSCSVASRDMSDAEVPAPSPPSGGGSTNLNVAGGTDVSPGAGHAAARPLRKHGLALLWKKLRSLRRRAYRHTLARGRGDGK